MAPEDAAGWVNGKAGWVNGRGGGGGGAARVNGRLVQRVG